MGERGETIRPVVVGVGIALAAWLALALGPVPGLLPRLYSGDLPGWVPAARLRAWGGPTPGDATAKWGRYTRDGALAIVLIGLVAGFVRASRGAGFARRVVGPATPGTLGAMRALVFGLIAVLAVREDLPSLHLLPAGSREAKGVMRLLDGLPIAPSGLLADAGALRAVQAVTVGLAALAAAGLATRWTVPLAALADLVFGGLLRASAHFFHVGLLPLYLAAALALVPCGDGFSLDRLIRRARGRPVPPADVPAYAYGWGRYLLWGVVAISYFLAGLSKLRYGGPGWGSPENLRELLIAENLNPSDWGFEFGLWARRAPDWFFGALGFGTVVAETGYLLVLVSPRARLVFPAAMLATHLGILVLQNILFLDLIVVQALFYDWGAPGRRLLGRPGRREASPDDPAGGAVARRVRRALAGFAAVSFAVWLGHVEAYPLTGWRMYSTLDHDGRVEYLRVLARYADGTTRPPRLSAWVPALAERRFMDILVPGFDDADRRAVALELLATCRDLANADRRGGPELTGFEVQWRRWSYLEAPDDPDRGETVKSYRLPPPPGRGPGDAAGRAP